VFSQMDQKLTCMMPLWNGVQKGDGRESLLDPKSVFLVFQF
jgi:hypothetical protein